MRIGILTFHRAHNYGANLQAFCLQEYLSSIGHDTFIIDYMPDYFRDLYELKPFRVKAKNPLRLLRNIRIMKSMNYEIESRYNAFSAFQNSFYNLLPIEKIGSLDIVILGSDQIWNKNITGGRYDDFFWGVNVSIPTIAYAASGMVSVDTDADKQYVTGALGNMVAIGVREEKLKDILKYYSNKEIAVTVDPTLLGGRTCLDKMKTAPLISKKYILIYELVVHTEVRMYAEKLSKETGWNIVELTNLVNPKKLHIANQTASPSDFVSLIYNAEVVLTTSFHGTAVSVCYNKDFLYFRQNNQSDIRIENLLNSIQLQDRIVPMSYNGPIKHVDYSCANILLTDVVVKSKAFINQSLQIYEN